jgi:hypothetical protein
VFRFSQNEFLEVPLRKRNQFVSYFFPSRDSGDTLLTGGEAIA